MSSKIQIWSMASVMLGNGVQQDDTANNEFISSVSAIYDTLYESRLASTRWGFARKKLALSKFTDAPLNEWTTQYQIPADALVIYKMYPLTDYMINQDRIFTNADSLAVDYITKPSNEGYLPEYFVVALVLDIAARLAYPITDNANLAQGYAGQAKDAWRTAWTLDAMQHPAETAPASPIIWARHA